MDLAADNIISPYFIKGAKVLEEKLRATIL